VKNKIFESYDKAIEEVFDGAIIAHSIFGTASQALNLWEALSRKDVKNLTIVGNMAHSRLPTPQGPHLPTYGPINCILQPGKVKRIITGFTSHVYGGETEYTREYDAATKNMEVIPVPFGNLCTRLEAAACGYGGILTPVGVGTASDGSLDSSVRSSEATRVRPLALRDPDLASHAIGVMPGGVAADQ